MNEQTTTDTGINFAPSWGDVADASTDTETRRKLEERFPTRKVSKLVEVPLTDAEIADKGRELAGLEKEITDAKNLLKEECARLRGEVKVLETKRAGIAREIENGKGQVEIACIERLVFETNSIQVVREDDGTIVSERALTLAERQGEFFDSTPVDGEVTDPHDLLNKMNADADADADADAEDDGAGDDCGEGGAS